MANSQLRNNDSKKADLIVQEHESTKIGENPVTRIDTAEHC